MNWLKQTIFPRRLLNDSLGGEIRKNTLRQKNRGSWLQADVERGKEAGGTAARGEVVFGNMTPWLEEGTDTQKVWAVAEDGETGGSEDRYSI